MNTKTFLVVLGAIITFVILAGIWFISISDSEQRKLYFEAQINQSQQQFEIQFNKTTDNFKRSLLIHENMFANITDIKNGLDPVLETIDNATQMRVDQDRHYNKADIHFTEVQNITDLLKAYSNGTDRVIKEKLHSGLLIEMNQTLSEFINGNNNGNQSMTTRAP